jgi:hypothetical protein
MILNAFVSVKTFEKIPDARDVLETLKKGRDYFDLPHHPDSGASGVVLTHTGTLRLLESLGIVLGATSYLEGASLTGGERAPYGAADLSSVTLVRNAKGGVQPEVKVYDADPEQARQRAVYIFEQLITKYPAIG